LIAGRVFDAIATYQPVFQALAGLAIAGLVLVNFLQPARIESARTG
jgi:hypothetical protein